MALGASREDAASEIVTVLTEAPRQSLPARYRDERAPQRSTGLRQPGHSTNGTSSRKKPWNRRTEPQKEISTLNVLFLPSHHDDDLEVAL